MGGRGTMRLPVGERIQEYKATGYIAGVKVLEPVKGTKGKHGNLPDMSNTPGTSYIALTKSGDIKKFRAYGKDREIKIEIEFDHSHRGIRPHITEWKDGKRTGEGRALTKTERRKYAKILKAAGY